MFQIKCTGGFEIQVLSPGGAAKMGYEARVEEQNVTRFTGSLEACRKWVADRGIREGGTGQTAADIAVAGRGNR